jgi:hypothetical protein
MKSNIDKAIDLVEQYAPEYFKENAVGIIDTLMRNTEFTTSLINFCKFAKERGLEVEIPYTIMHDIAGLHNGEEFFLPRVSEY